jgi:peptidoglycan hydrolase-like protein with peptidoglycan-binding domain
MAYWAARGLRRADGGALGAEKAALLLPAGAAGPAFLVTRNFDALTSYNSAEAYGLAIGLLADRLGGGKPLAAPWPGGVRGLSRAERKDVQAILRRRGYDIGDSDGVFGDKTRAAIAREDIRLGLPSDGWASESFYARLRANP